MQRNHPFEWCIIVFRNPQNPNILSSIPKLINRHRFLYFGIILFVIALGLGSRTSYIPDFIYPYLGDFLYAVMMYFMFAFLLPKCPQKNIAFLAMGICFAIEFFQMYQAPWVNEIRHTRLGTLTLGSGFLWSDLLCYALGGAMGFVLETIGYKEKGH